MDCRTARLLLDFARPRAPELDAVDAAALEDHLFQCRACAVRAGAERRLDEQLGRVMGRVEVPPGLKGMILDRTAAARADWSRRRLQRWARPLAVAAVLLVSVLGVWAWGIFFPPRVDLEQVMQKRDELAVAPPGRDARMAEFKTQFGVSTVFPEELNYLLLKEMALGYFQDKKVPLLIFNRHDQVRASARVFILSDWDFNLKGLAGHDPLPPGYEKMDFFMHRSGRFAYVIFYTGDDWRWLRTESLAL
jgi:hypothetical protein